MHRDAGWYGYGHIPDTSIYNEIEDNEIKRFIPLLKDINLDNYSEERFPYWGHRLYRRGFYPANIQK